MKKISIVLAVLILLVAAAVMVVISQAGSLVQRGVESYGPQITGTSVELSDVDISLLSGYAKINNLVIANPPGFKSPSAFKVAQVSLKLELQSLFSDQIHIEQIVINGAELSYEQINRHSNLDVLRKNIEQHTATDKITDGASSSTSGNSKLQMVIDDLSINGTKVNVLVAVLGTQEQLTLTIPDIHLRDLGGKDNESISAVVHQVVEQITKAASKEVLKAVAQRELKKLKLSEQEIKATIDKEKDKLLKKLNDKLSDKLKDLF